MLIEASFAPYVFVVLVWEYYIECINSIFDEYQSLSTTVITLKVLLFFLMRCTESQADFFLNRSQKKIFIGNFLNKRMSRYFDIYICQLS